MSRNAQRPGGITPPNREVPVNQAQPAARDARSIQVVEGRFDIRGGGWQEYELDGAIEAVARHSINRQRSLQDHQWRTQLTTVSAGLLALVIFFGMMLTAGLLFKRPATGWSDPYNAQPQSSVAPQHTPSA